MPLPVSPVALATLLALFRSARPPIVPSTTTTTIPGALSPEQRLANDGKFLAYGLFPQEGDGEIVVRNLVTGQDTRFPAAASGPNPGGHT